MSKASAPQATQAATVTDPTALPKAVPDQMHFWGVPSTELLRRLETTPQGLTGSEASLRLARLGSNIPRSRGRSGTITLLISQFSGPIILLLLFASGLSFFLEDPFDAIIILAIVLASGLLGFWQERGAADAVEKLLAIVEIKATVLRNGTAEDVSLADIVPGDVTILNAGDIIPGDCLILESKDLFVDEATLTGETYPVAKSAGAVEPDAPLARRTNALFMGTHVISGNANAVVVHTGKQTEFGKVSERLQLRPPETEFEHGVRRFGYLLMEVTLVLVLAIFAINVYFHRPVLDSFLFALALAVGLTPQLLPAIISINLAQGAKRMAQEKVIVKRLASIENFGSMNVLCSDKTGTLTEGLVRLDSALDIRGSASEKVLLYAFINASYEMGFTNPIDAAIREYCAAHRQFDLSGYQKLDEVPYDFVRKRLTILVEKDGKHLMITKGAVQSVLDVCSYVETPAGPPADIASVRAEMEQQHEELSARGFRTLGLAYRDVGALSRITREHETGMTFLGLLVLNDPPKPRIIETIESLNKLGIQLKIITGDNRTVAASISKQVGLSYSKVLTGKDLSEMSDEALRSQVNEVNLFAEVEPNQKERVILALRKSGNVVGYLGDGINDASALHVADVGISVDTAVDVAKEAADIVLLEKDLGVLAQGVSEGRVTFANTLKYVFITTSANFGNMFSMAGVSLFLPFLPLLPKQILLNNFLTDLPAMTIAADSVDTEMVERPRRWDIGFIRNFMIVFGLQSSVFDFLTFGALLLLLHATPEQFRTGWFIESAISEVLILLVVRTRRPFFKSKPGRYLVIASVLVVGVVLSLPYIPFLQLNEWLGFTPIPLPSLLLLAAILVLYITSAEIVKRLFYRVVKA